MGFLKKLFGKGHKSRSKDAGESKPLHAAAEMQESTDVSVIDMPYHNLTLEQLQELHERLAAFIAEDPELSNAIADLWIVDLSDGHTIWVVCSGHFDTMKEFSIYKRLDQLSGEEHLGCGSKLLKFALKEKGLRILKRMKRE